MILRRWDIAGDLRSNEPPPRSGERSYKARRSVLVRPLSLVAGIGREKPRIPNATIDAKFNRIAGLWRTYRRRRANRKVILCRLATGAVVSTYP